MDRTDNIIKFRVSWNSKICGAFLVEAVGFMINFYVVWSKNSIDL